MSEVLELIANKIRSFEVKLKYLREAFDQYDANHPAAQIETNRQIGEVLVELRALKNFEALLKSMIVCLCLWLTACGPAPAHKQADPHGAYAVSAFGDSFTARDGSYINKVASDYGWSLDNYAQSNTTISDQLAMAESVNLDQTDFVVMFVGLNDARYNGMDEAKLEQYARDLKNAIDLILTHSNVKQVWIANCARTLSPEYTALSSTAYVPDSATGLYAQTTALVVAQYNGAGVALIDVHSQWTPEPKLYGSDYTHPDEAGNLALTLIFEKEMNK